MEIAPFLQLSKKITSNNMEILELCVSWKQYSQERLYHPPRSSLSETYEQPRKVS